MTKSPPPPPTSASRSRCHYTKSNPIDDHSNISSKKLQKQNFKPLSHYTCMQCGTSHLQTVQENILSHIILATYRKFTVATVRFTQNVSCNIYTHPHISTSGKCHCVIIHQTTKATIYIGYMSKYLRKSPLSHICTNHIYAPMTFTPYKFHGVPPTLIWQSLHLVQCYLKLHYEVVVVPVVPSAAPKTAFHLSSSFLFSMQRRQGLSILLLLAQLQLKSDQL